MPSTTWLITGASSGFGHHLEQRVLDEGADVIAVARRGDRLGTIKAAAGRLTTLVLDITAPHAEDELRRAIEAHGRLDVLVNNAGLGLFGSVEQTSDIEARMVMDTNFFGMLNALRAALPALRASKGRIVQMSSLLGRFAWPSSGLYSASKAAVELMSEALARARAPAAGRWVSGIGSGSSLFMKAELRQLGGALGRSRPGAGAVAKLDGRFQLITGGMMVGEMAKRTVVDCERVVGAMAPYSRGREYLNFQEEPVDLSTGYDTSAWEALLRIRKAIDPNGLFQADHEIPHR
jgi:NADP-dependent 3-hydroxy acid dehydrogenase YdfG